MPNGIFTLRQQVDALRQGAWTNQKTPFVNYLVVAGGGGGGYIAGGGGAGGLLSGVIGVSAGAAITTTVGAGGAGGTGGNQGASGANAVFGAISATGGGAGGSYPNADGASGGSGGGADNPITLGGLHGTFGQGISGQGNAGGLSWAGSNFTGGGGGGAGTVGLNSVAANGSPAGNGGAGVVSAISGTVTAYSGGGGGAADTNGTGGLGGVGGGGAGGVSRGATGGSGTINGVSGSANTGGGGGGYGVSGTGGSGGSGVVIISYPDTYLAPIATTGSPTVSTSGSGSISFPDAGGSGPTSGPGFIQFAGTSALAIGATGTYEFWIYPTRYAGIQHRVISQGNAANGAPDISYDASNLYVTATSGGGSATASGAPPLNTWTHVAIVLTSGTLTVYYNGVARSLSGTTTGYNMTNTSTMFVSGYSGIVGQYGVIGNLSNVRIVKGVAVYTGAFTTPAAPLQTTQPSGVNISAITGTATSLLLGSVSGSFLSDSSTNSYVASSVSTSTAAPTWNQLSPFATGLGFKNRVYTWTSSGSITF